MNPQILFLLSTHTSKTCTTNSKQNTKSLWFKPKCLNFCLKMTKEISNGQRQWQSVLYTSSNSGGNLRVSKFQSCYFYTPNWLLSVWTSNACYPVIPVKPPITYETRYELLFWHLLWWNFNFGSHMTCSACL